MAFPFSSSLAAPCPQPAPLHLPLQPPRVSPLPFPLPLAPPLLRLGIRRSILPALPIPNALSASAGGDDGDHNNNSGGGGGGEENAGGGDDDGAPDHRGEALFVLAQLGRKLESLPSDLAAAVEGGRVTGEIVRRFNELERSALFRWLLQFRGFRERLLADDLFLAKLGMECGVGVIAKVLILFYSILSLFFYLFSPFFSYILFRKQDGCLMPARLGWYGIAATCMTPPI
jgi:hypothetical protein